MKLRILGDTLRLRLSQSDVRALLAHGHTEATIHFAPDRTLTYAVCLDARADAVRVDYEAGDIVVRLPEPRARAWAEGDRVGIEAEQLVAPDRMLSVLVEKDFKCLAPRSGEESYDGFPHPGGDSGTC